MLSDLDGPPPLPRSLFPLWTPPTKVKHGKLELLRDLSEGRRLSSFEELVGIQHHGKGASAVSAAVGEQPGLQFDGTQQGGGNAHSAQAAKVAATEEALHRAWLLLRPRGG